MSEPVAATSSAPSTSSNQGGGNNPAPSKNPSSSSPNPPPSQTAPAAVNQAADTVREYKIDGQMVRLTQKEADDYVAMSGAAQKRFRESAQIKKEAEARDQEYTKSPLKSFIDYAK